MIFIDTHSHIYLDQFDADRSSVIERAVANGVKKILLPNVDVSTIEPMHKLVDEFPDVCLPMIGLHPTSVDGDFRRGLKVVEELAATCRYCAIGEIGIDLYWDKTFQKEQEYAFVYQLEIAKYYKLPVAIHGRKAMNELLRLLKGVDVQGVFHCYGGSVEEVRRVLDMGFYIGIGGVVTYKNASLVDVVRETPLDRILLETDSPYLPPVPYRGERNESTYIPIIATKVAEIKNVDISLVAEQTTASATKLFNLSI